MFCYQCEQTAKGEACSVRGVCGKNPEVADLQDLLTCAVRGLAQVAVEGRKVDVTDAEVDAFACEALFATVTNVSFDPDAIEHRIRQCVILRDALAEKVQAAGGNVAFSDGPAAFVPAATRDGLLGQAAPAGLMADETIDADLRSLQHILLFGLRDRKSVV